MFARICCCADTSGPQAALRPASPKSPVKATNAAGAAACAAARKAALASHSAGGVAQLKSGSPKGPACSELFVV